MTILCGWLVGWLGSATADAAPKHPAACDAARRCSQPLEGGEAAPWPGVLLNPAKSIELGQLAEHCPDQIAIEVAHTSSIARINLAFQRQIGAIALSAMTHERDLWKAQAESVPVTPWYERPAILVPLAVLGTLATVYLATRVVELGGH